MTKYKNYIIIFLFLFMGGLNSCGPASPAVANPRTVEEAEAARARDKQQAEKVAKKAVKKAEKEYWKTQSKEARKKIKKTNKRLKKEERKRKRR